MRILWLDEADIDLKDADMILIKTEYLKSVKYIFFSNLRTGGWVLKTCKSLKVCG